MAAIEQAPVVPLGSGAVIPALVRTSGQGISAGFLVQGIQLFELVDLTEAQATWLTIALFLLLTGVQNALEQAKGRQLLGRAPAPAVAPPEPE